ncbi:unnamed protein product [Vitrella brassicaformis CCMP3155]|uniref:CHHC U11-48K-type domain-containing protein n=1 Tax=Vitrella brassicaformis (strain CCMP3155) TaxID=1169540 RepID=A0A0G4EPE5_VITBC|nr:unnamed protein product [Vitrella brassicaformis CCMP3155]|eukprot:CEL99304.1 unnamed protein product [Vitrella brassicaformis CCMP3155]
MYVCMVMVEIGPKKQGHELDTEEKVQCFFGHLVPKSKLRRHYEYRCTAYREMKDQLKYCQYNDLHMAWNDTEMERHERTCPDRKPEPASYIDTFRTNHSNAPSTGEWSELGAGAGGSSGNSRAAGGCGDADDQSEVEESVHGPPSMYGAAGSEYGYGCGGRERDFEARITRLCEEERDLRRKIQQINDLKRDADLGELEPSVDDQRLIDSIGDYEQLLAGVVRRIEELRLTRGLRGRQRAH